MSNQHVVNYIEEVTPYAVQVERLFQVPSAIVIAVSALETGWGKSIKGNNYFGIKGQGQTFMTHEYIDGEKVGMSDSFRKYETAEESFLDYGRFLVSNKRYANAFSYTHDPSRFARELQAAGYATDPNYAEKIISIITRWKLDSGIYPDLPKGHWAEEAIRLMTQEGIMEGFPDGKFHPDEGVTRAELSVILSRLISKKG